MLGCFSDFLVLSRGAKVLETRLLGELSSDQYHATAKFYVGKVQLHNCTRGVRVLLLLVLCSFTFYNRVNAWFLTSTIIARCLDLGLQREHVNSECFSVYCFTNDGALYHLQNSTIEENHLDSHLRELRSDIFWSA